MAQILGIIGIVLVAIVCLYAIIAWISYRFFKKAAKDMDEDFEKMSKRFNNSKIGGFK